MYAIHVCVCVSVYNYTKGESYATASMTVTCKRTEAGARKLNRSVQFVQYSEVELSYQSQSLLCLHRQVPVGALPRTARVGWSQTALRDDLPGSLPVVPLVTRVLVGGLDASARPLPRLWAQLPGATSLQCRRSTGAQPATHADCLLRLEVCRVHADQQCGCANVRRVRGRSLHWARTRAFHSTGSTVAASTSPVDRAGRIRELPQVHPFK